ncbi:hypothetical protein E2I00_013592, partial [Balaenoptera physalus]
VFAVCGLGLLGVAVSTDHWLYLEEGVVLPQNQSTETKMSLHSGLWRVCFLAGEERGRCFTIEYVMPVSPQLTSESTVNVLKMTRSATPFPLVSLFFMFIGFILSNIGHIRPHRTILAFRCTAEDAYGPHPGFYRPRLSNCSDHSGQFLHPDAWARGRSPSDISSDVSLQMSGTHPALLGRPDYRQLSSSPC